MKNLAKSFEIWESINIGPRLRLPKQVEVDASELYWIKSLKWRDFRWSEIGGDGDNIIWLDLNTVLDTDLFDGVVVDIQRIHNTFNQIHISMAESLRGIGLGTKIYKSLLHHLGHIYSSKRRGMNPIIYDVLKNISKDKTITHVSNGLGDLYVYNGFEFSSDIIDYFNKI
tara:strand:+ start:5313 stop:5822 length:510 start_codon:yes stop_codon:yes gene_type:complete